MLFYSFFPFGFQVSVKWFGGPADMSSSYSLDAAPGELLSLGGVVTNTHIYWVSGGFSAKAVNFVVSGVRSWTDEWN